MRKRFRSNGNSENLVGWLMLAPGLILVTIFMIYPSFQSIALSFFKWNGFTAWRFNGVENYIEMFTRDRFFYQSFINTVIFQLGATFGTVFVGFVLAAIIDLKVKLWRSYRIIFFLPYVLAQFAVATLWGTIFSPTGLANEILARIGLESLQVAWFGIPWVAKVVMIFVAIWQYSSFPMIFFLAGMQNIDEEIYEAAEIDGATKLQRITRITIPLLKNVGSIIIILQLILSFKVFTYVFIMTEGKPANQTHVLGTLLFRYAFEFQQFGYSSVLSILMIIMALIFGYVYLKTSGYSEIIRKKKV